MAHGGRRAETKVKNHYREVGANNISPVPQLTPLAELWKHFLMMEIESLVAEAPLPVYNTIV